MSRTLVASVLFLSAFNALGCSAAADVDEDEGVDTSEEALRTAVKPGTFKLYDEPNADPPASCDRHTVLDLKQVGRHGVAALRGALVGTCKIYVEPNPREFKLTTVATSCGSKIYRGSRTVNGRSHRIKITDHRSRRCRDLVLAKIIVEETVPGLPGTHVRYSDDSVPTPQPVAKVSGYDFEGPKALPNDMVPEICTMVMQPEQMACQAVGGTTLQANGCKVLCSEPIARAGKVAGYGFTGFNIVDAPRPGIMCPMVVSSESMACYELGGDTTRVVGCSDVCSVPIAPAGKAAGYDLTGFKTLSNDVVHLQDCLPMVTPVQAACGAVNGVTRPVNECQHLCSLPL